MAKCNSHWSVDGKRRSDVVCTLEQDHDGECSGLPDLDYLSTKENFVALPFHKPQAWQSKAPDPDYETSKFPVQPSAELTRIVALPRRAQPTPAELETLTTFMTNRLARDREAEGLGPCRCEELQREHGMVDPNTGKTPGCITTLRPIQAWALLEIATKSGLLGPIGVGHGKTILDLLASLLMPKCRTAVLLVPPRLVKQLMRDYKIVGQHFKMPSMFTHDSNAFSAVAPGMPALHVFPYSRLSRPESTDYLERVLAPDTIIADEVHKLKAADTATTSRVLRYFKNHPETRFCGWSGSMTDKSIKDYAHLAALALRLSSPLPVDPEIVEDWARCIDPPGPDSKRAPEGALEQLCEPGEDVLHAFHRRLVDTAGVVATRVAAVDAVLEIAEREAPPIPTTPGLFQPDPEKPPMSLARAIQMVRAWKRPDGEPIPDALQRNAQLIRLACGFFYRWRFPLVHGQPQNISTILEWLAIRKAWAAEVRAAIRSRREHFDSEKLARNAAERFYGERPITDKKLPVWQSAIYPAWRDVEHAVVYESEPIWIDTFLAEDAAKWAHENRGIVWYSEAAFGEKVAEIAGLPRFGAGKEAAKQIVRYDGRTSIIASIDSHGTGTDGLQFKYHENLVGNPGSSNEEWEQLLGRTHRVGQSAGCVRTLFYRHTPELVRCVNQALRRAGYVQGTMGSDQKLVLSGLSMADPPEDDDTEFEE
jgi:hypothetical protein